MAASRGPSACEHLNQRRVGFRSLGVIAKSIACCDSSFDKGRADRPGRLQHDGSPENARRACEGSLKRLGIESIDLFYQRRVDPNVPIEETVGGGAREGGEGCVSLACRKIAVPTVRRAAKAHPIAALQSEYSIWQRDPEDDILPACRQNGIGFAPYSQLDAGFRRAAFAVSTTCPAMTGDPTILVILPRICQRTSPSSTPSPKSPNTTVSPTRKSGLRGYWRGARTSCPFLA